VIMKKIKREPMYSLKDYAELIGGSVFSMAGWISHKDKIEGKLDDPHHHNAGMYRSKINKVNRYPLSVLKKAFADYSK